MSSPAQLKAWILAWPWADEGAWTAPFSSWEEPGGQACRARLQGWLVHRAGGRSLEELELAFSAVWRSPSGGWLPLSQGLQRAAGQILEARGGAWYLRPQEGVARWRPLRTSLPLPWLLAAAGEARAPAPMRLQALSPALSPILDEGLAETHLHMGEAATFEEHWSRWMGRVSTLRLAELADPRLPLGGGRALLSALISYAVARLALARQLCAPELGLPGGPDPAQRRPEVAAELRRLLSPVAPGSVHQLLERQAALARYLGRDHVERRDPLSHLRGGGPGNVLLQRLLGRGSSLDPALLPLAHQCLRLHMLFFRVAVQEPGVQGLGWFRQGDSRARSFKSIDPAPLRSALQATVRHPHRAAVELRMRPCADPAELRRVLAWTAHELRRAPRPPRLGLLLSWSRSPPKSRPARSRAERLGRHATWVDQQVPSLMALRAALERWPLAGLLIRGVDLLGEELALPHWVCLPILRSARALLDRAGLRLSRSGWELPPTGLTVHVGEQQLSPIQGLRRVSELLSTGLLRPGDRLGHGLTLCAPSSPSSSWISREELLCDLVWEYNLHRAGSLGEPVPGRPLQLLGQLQDQLRELGWSGPQDATAFLGLPAALLHPPTLRAAGWTGLDRHMLFRPLCRPDGAPPAPPRLMEMLRQWVLDRAFQRRLAEPVELQAPAAQVVGPLRSLLRGELARLGITIESCPSSNSQIGDLPDPRHQPAFSLSSPDGADTPDGPSLWCSVNTDDPLQFCTSLEEELQVLEVGASSRGWTQRQIRDWMVELMRQARQSSFALPESREAGPLDQLWRSLRPSPLLMRHYLRG